MDDTEVWREAVHKMGVRIGVVYAVSNLFELFNYCAVVINTDGRIDVVGTLYAGRTACEAEHICAAHYCAYRVHV